MPRLTRRNFTALAGASLAAAQVPLFAPRAVGQAKPKLVVIGGGPGGGTAGALRQQGRRRRDRGDARRAAKAFTTCFFSNLYVGGFRSYASITHDYDKVARARRAGGQRVGERDRPRAQDGAARGGHARALRPPRGRARHRSQVRFRPRLLGGGRRNHAARLAGGHANAVADQAPRRPGGRLPHRDDRSA